MAFVSLPAWQRMERGRSVMPLMNVNGQTVNVPGLMIDSATGTTMFTLCRETNPHYGLDDLPQDVINVLAKAGVSSRVEDAGQDYAGAAQVNIVVEGCDPLKIADILKYDRQTREAVRDFEEQRICGTTQVVVNTGRPATRYNGSKLPAHEKRNGRT